MTNQVSPLMASTRSIWLFLQEGPFSLIVWADERMGGCHPPRHSFQKLTT